jgi:hypothetical protein
VIASQALAMTAFLYLVALSPFADIDGIGIVGRIGTTVAFCVAGASNSANHVASGFLP